MTFSKQATGQQAEHLTEEVKAVGFRPTRQQWLDIVTAGDKFRFMRTDEHGQALYISRDKIIWAFGKTYATQWKPDPDFPVLGSFGLYSVKPSMKIEFSQ